MLIWGRYLLLSFLSFCQLLVPDGRRKPRPASPACSLLPSPACPAAPPPSLWLCGGCRLVIMQQAPGCPPFPAAQTLAAHSGCSTTAEVLCPPSPPLV